MTQKISKKEKIMRKLDKPTEIISIILVIIMMIMVVASIINWTLSETPPTPMEEEINKTCERFNMYPAGHIISYKEQKTYILCKIPHSNFKNE